MKKTATYRNILPTQEEINFYEREDELARKSQLAKVQNKNYKNRIQELRLMERDNLSETEFYRNSLISALTLPEFFSAFSYVWAWSIRTDNFLNMA